MIWIMLRCSSAQRGKRRSESCARRRSRVIISLRRLKCCFRVSKETSTEISRNLGNFEERRRYLLDYGQGSCCKLSAAEARGALARVSPPASRFSWEGADGVLVLLPSPKRASSLVSESGSSSGTRNPRAGGDGRGEGWIRKENRQPDRIRKRYNIPRLGTATPPPPWASRSLCQQWGSISLRGRPLALMSSLRLFGFFTLQLRPSSHYPPLFGTRRRHCGRCRSCPRCLSLSTSCIRWFFTMSHTRYVALLFSWSRQA